jgi:DNA-binding CsgD family transcriptional regulator
MSSLAPGSVLGDFRIEGLVGRGGMGMVYHAVQISLGRPVALKLIAPHLADEEGFRQRFLQESRLSASIDHPHIVPVYGAGEEEGVPYIAMRFVEGVNLRVAIAAAERFKPARAARLVWQVASALDSAHERGLVHRDVKPANILVSQHAGTEHAYLTDFGLTKRRLSGSGLTGTGEWVGSLDYVAPEQLRGSEVDGRADVYSLGCVLYQCLTGEVPFPREDELAKLWAHVSDPPPSATDAVTEVSPSMSALVQRAMAKAPDDRFGSAGALADAVVAAVSSDTRSPAKVLDVAPDDTSEGSASQPSQTPTRGRARGAGAGRLYERERELRQAAVELDVAASGSGRTFLIEGQAGIGKTSLLKQVALLAEERGFDIYSACGMELERDYAYGVVRQLFEYRLHRMPPDERAGLFRGAAGLAEPLLLRAEQAATAPDVGTPHKPADRVFAAVHGLYWFCAELSERTPLLLAIDDADRADQASLRFLAHLVPRLDGLSVAVAIVCRPTEPGPEAQLLDQVERRANLRLSPGPLSPDGSAALVRGRLGGGDSELCAACHRAARGNPFLLGELCATMTADGLAPTAAAAPVVEGLATQKIADSSLDRVARVAPDARRLVQVAALMGPGAELRQAAALAELELTRAASLADSLVKLGVLSSSRPLEFVHPVVRTSIAKDQPAGARALLHTRAARLLADEGADGELVCAHLMQATPAGDGWAVEQLLKTARAALGQGAPEAAASLLARALSEPPTKEQRVEVLCELGRAEALGPDPASAVEHLRAALGMAPERESREELMAELMSTLWHLGRRAELLELARDELERCDRHTPLESRRRLEAALLMGLKFNVEHYDELDSRLDALAPELIGDSPAERVMLAVVAQRRVERAEPVEQAVAAARRALERGLLADHAPSLRAPSGVALRALIESDEHEEAARWIAEGLALARARGSRLGLLTAHRFLAELAYRAGDLTQAEADARLVANTWLEFHSLAAYLAAAILAQTLVARGRVEQAYAALDPLGDALEYRGFPNSAVAAARGDLAIAVGDPAGARAEYARAGMEFPYSGWRPGAARAHLLLDEREKAIELADEELVRARRFGAPRSLGIALRMAGLCHGGERGLRSLEQSILVLRESPARLELATSLFEVGAVLRRAERPDDSRRPLREALELAHRCGAQPLAEQAQTELVALGDRPREPAASRAESLSATELRVCQLAADGLSNAEIAQALFVTRRAVETHLGNAYRKLDIASQVELAQALGRHVQADAEALAVGSTQAL